MNLRNQKSFFDLISEINHLVHIRLPNIFIPFKSNTHTRSTYINFLKNKLNQKNYENPSKLKSELLN